jgi:hypothetical protein
MDAEVILATPIRDDFEDMVAWHYNSKGVFTVKSAYRLYVKMRDGPQQSSSAQENQSLNWEKIWKMACPPKIKQFIWRFAHNSLPLKLNIKRRGIDCDSLCLCCHRLDEDGAHLFFKCKEVRGLWADLQIEKERKQLSLCPDAKAVVQDILAMGEEKSTLIACFLWRWWTRRNKINAKERTGEPIEIISQVRFWAGEAKQYCTNSTSDTPQTEKLVWQRPTGDILKINIDGSFFADKRTGGWGFVVRDQHGEIRGAGAGCLTHVLSAAQAEARACEEAIRAAAEWCMTNVQIESDSKILLVQAMRSAEFDRTTEGIIYRDMRLFMVLQFTSYEFYFVPRTCNNLAHSFAAFGASQQEQKLLWLDSIPDAVRVMVASDSAEPSI